MKYGFYSKADETQEIVKSKKFDSEQQAVSFFATTKQMTLEEFTKIYKVVLI
jgi:hypothetical protein